MYRSVAPEPLPPPVLYPAKIVPGEVEAPGDSENTSNAVYPDQQEAMPTPPTSLERSVSLSGNILIVESPQGERAYWLQRKMCKTTRGSVRLGFRVTRREGASATWTVQPATHGPYSFEMVAIKVQSRAACEHVPKVCRDPKVETSALQMLCKHDPEGVGTVVAGLICADQDNIFIIMPYFGEGSLAEYIAECGRLSEGVSRHFFRQIISVRWKVLV